jgi:glutathione synthase/RimK-type ligase-like ATP-grasp enzyme
MPPHDCTLVTCEAFPALDPDDRLLADELRKRGVTVSIATWNDPHVDWSAASLCVLRSTWDYHQRYDEFIAWLERTAALTTLCNNERLLKWNADKSYIRDIEARGVPVVPTVWVAQGARRSLQQMCTSLGWESVVVKPARGAAAHDVLLVRREKASLANGQPHLDRLLAAQDVLVQPYLKSVETYGERALMFFAGRYSHAVVKKPFDTVLAVSDERSARVQATDGELEVAVRAIAAIPGQALYARVDLLHDDDGNARVSEVELIEPGLYLSVHRPAVSAFADAIERELATFDSLSSAGVDGAML